MAKLTALWTMLTVLLICCYALPNETSQKKKSLVQKIVQKVSDLSLRTIANSPSEEKSRLLNKLKAKLEKAAKSLGHKKNKYIKLIMKGLALKSYDNKFKIEQQEINPNPATNNTHNKLVNSVNNTLSAGNVDEIPGKTESHQKEEAHEYYLVNEKQDNNINLNRGEKNNGQEMDEHNNREIERNGQNRAKIDSEIIIRQNPDITLEIKTDSTPQTIKKAKIISNISNKLRALVDKYIKNAKTEDARKNIIESIKERFKKTGERKNRLLRRHDGIKIYADLIGKGVKVFLQHNINTFPNEIANLTRRMDTISDDIKIVNKTSKESNISHKNNDILDDKALSLKEKIVSPFSMLFKIEYAKERVLNISCDDNVKEICSKIKALNTFTCEKDNKVMHITKICDGKSDCLDSSDEANCVRQALDCVKNISRVMSLIDSSVAHTCYKDLQDNGNLSRQNKVFRNVLQKHLDLLQKHTVVDLDIRTRRVYNDESLRNTVNEVTHVVNIFSAALEAAACKQNIVKTENESSLLKYRAVEEPAKVSWSPKMCNCNKQYCFEPCPLGCADICWQKHSLSQFQCQAVNGERSIPIDMVCDGKLDCIDETDEIKCFEENSVTKYEATEMFNHILKLIMDKISSRKNEAIRKDLVKLHGLVTKLQKLSLSYYDKNVLEVKSVRENCFREMILIYSKALRYLSTPEEAVEVYIFLLMLNEKLISAMKRSHTGNNKIMVAKECVCRGYQCASHHCTNSCKRACSAEPKLTRYFCSGSNVTNNSVPMEVLCDGKKDCPGGDDEDNCKKEVCRNHHLKVLKLNIQNAGERYEGTSIGEALTTWKIKATSTLEHTEGKDRPTLTVIRDILRDTLQDLVMAYATIEDYRRGSSKAFEEFQFWSRVVIDVARSCV